MKPAFIGLGSMFLLVSASPIPSGSTSSLVPANNGVTLEKRAELDPVSLETLSGNALEKRASRTMNIPNHAGTVIQNLMGCIVKAVVDAAGSLIFEIANYNGGVAKVSFHEGNIGLDAANFNIAAHHIMTYNPHGAIKPGDAILIDIQT
ncbi:hypothetical protein H9Q69_012308 [Fusarium xylarioides]|nr:hypothetical protein H9Q69_012308 [Fusarium xylarioides]